MELMNANQQSLRAFLGMCFVLLLSAETLHAQQTINVPSDYPTIQQALNAAEQNTIINVSAGTYIENLVWPSVNGIELKGINGRENTIIDGNNDGRVISIEGWSTADILIDGFTIQNGFTNNIDGAGIYSRDGAIILKNLIVQNNRGEGNAVWGGGAHIEDFSGELDNCIFRNNILDTDSRSYGAGLNLDLASNAEIKNCEFYENHGSTNSWCYGGGLYASSFGFSSDPYELKITNCSFTDNSTTTSSWSSGAGIYIYSSDELFSVRIDSSRISGNTTNNSNWSDGAGIFAGLVTMDIKNSLIDDNTSQNASAIYWDGDSFGPSYLTIENTKIQENKISGNSTGSVITYRDESNIELKNVIISNNQGNVINNEIVNVASLKFLNSTVFNNGGPINIQGTHLEATNSIFWNPGHLELEEGTIGWGAPNTFDIKNCIARNTLNGANVIFSNPILSSNFIPLDNSPCLGAGTLDDYTLTDINGFDRPMPLNANPDIGAHEVNESLSFIRVKFYYDANSDGTKNTDERYISHGSVRLQDEVYNNFSENGMILRLEQDQYTLAYDYRTTSGWSSTSQEDYSFEVQTDDFYDEFEFGLNPDIIFNDVATFIEGDPFRCGEDIRMSINIKNLGTSIEEGILWLDIDDRIEDFTFDIVPDHTLSTYRVGWDFADLYPFETFTVDFTITAPLIENEEQLGEIYTFKSFYDNSGLRDVMCYDTELRCSFDPNDKLVSPNREDELALLDDHLFYTIRFQNTGNDYARNVVVRDTLDSNLDLRTFSIASTSHPDKLNVIIGEDHTIAFEFLDIYLLDSLTNLEASNGHVSYHIKPLEGLPEETIIQNTAHIYFDFNPAIVTNTTNNILVEEFPTVSNNNIIINPITLFPNPTRQILNFSKRIDSGNIYTVNGALITRIGNSQYIDVSSLNDGIYFIEMELNGEIWKEKFTVLK